MPEHRTKVLYGREILEYPKLPVEEQKVLQRQLLGFYDTIRAEIICFAPSDEEAVHLVWIVFCAASLRDLSRRQTTCGPPVHSSSSFQFHQPLPKLSSSRNASRP